MLAEGYVSRALKKEIIHLSERLTEGEDKEGAEGKEKKDNFLSTGLLPTGCKTYGQPRLSQEAGASCGSLLLVLAISWEGELLGHRQCPHGVPVPQQQLYPLHHSMALTVSMSPRNWAVFCSFPGTHISQDLNCILECWPNRWWLK